MTNNMIDPEPLDYTDERDLARADDGIQPLPRNGGAHLKCKCGHAWKQHDGLGCLNCSCLQ